MKKYLQLMVVAVAVGMLGLCTTAVADIPDYVDYHATWDASGWTVEGCCAELYGDPEWKNDWTLWVPNVHIPEWIKYVWLEIEWNYEVPSTAPGIGIEAGIKDPPGGSVDIYPCPDNPDPYRNVDGDGWTYCWIIEPQPDWEEFYFDSAQYHNLGGGVRSVEVGTYCIPEPGTVSLLLIGSLMLGVVAVIRRKR